jgi:hypothetical protein
VAFGYTLEASKQKVIYPLALMLGIDFNQLNNGRSGSQIHAARIAVSWIELLISIWVDIVHDRGL